MAYREVQYECPKCGHTFTRSMLVEDRDGNPRCPRCPRRTCDALIVPAMAVISDAHYARRERVRQ